MRYRPPVPGEILLARHDGRLEARMPDDEPGRGVSVSWDGARFTDAASGKRSALRRAIGPARNLIDATCGFGVDAWTLARAGFRVTAVERVPIVAALVTDALERARESAPEIAARLTIVSADAREFLAQLKPNEAPEVIFMDPMFPARRRQSALSSKAMQFLSAVVGDDGDADALLQSARRIATNRVVVKRPPRAEALAPGVSFSIETKLLRFDVYLRGTAPGASSASGSGL